MADSFGRLVSRAVLASVATPAPVADSPALDHRKLDDLDRTIGAEAMGGLIENLDAEARKLLHDPVGLFEECLGGSVATGFYIDTGDDNDSGYDHRLR